VCNPRREEKGGNMKICTKIALAAIVAASFALPAMAGDWVYHGGPRSPDSLSSYVPGDFPYDGPYRSTPYGYGPYEEPSDGY
jgi:hypothetical protein